MSKGKRHSWGEERSYLHKTEVDCVECGVTKATLIEPAGAWNRHRAEFWRNGIKIECTATPPCEPQPAPA